MSERFTEPNRGAGDKNPPMPGWIKAMYVNGATKQYLYQQWLAGNIALKSEPQDWGAITDVVEVLQHVKVKSNPQGMPNFTVDQLKASAVAANQDNLDLQFAIAISDGKTINHNGKTYTYEEALARQTELTSLASTFTGAVKARHNPNSKVETTRDENLQMAVQTAQQAVDSAFATLTQELTTNPSTSKPFQVRYQQALARLAEAERVALDNNVDFVPRVTPTSSGDTTVAPKSGVQDFIKSVTPTATGNAPTTPTVRASTGGIPTRAQRGESSTPTVAPVGSTVPLGQGRDQGDFATPVKPTTTPTTLKTGGGTGAGSTNPVLRSAVNTALKDQGLADTPANRKKIRAEIAAKGGVVGGGQDNSWEAVFKANEPGYAWMFTDEMKTKYPDVFELFKKASAPGYDRDLFQRQFAGTSWYTTLAAGQTGRELTANVGSFNWGAGNLAKFLTNATHMGWTGENLKAEAYKELFKKGGDGKYVNDLAIKEVQASTPYLKLKKIGTSFFSPMSDERIIESLTGGISTDDVLRLARERAKIIYPHLASAIDAGLTLDDISYDYKRIAAETLGLSPDAVDMSSSKFNRAMKSGEGGKERMLSTGEWETLIRTDPSYGYHFTKTANQDVTDLGLSLARAWGKVG